MKKRTRPCRTSLSLLAGLLLFLTTPTAARAQLEFYFTDTSGNRLTELNVPQFTPFTFQLRLGGIPGSALYDAMEFSLQRSCAITPCDNLILSNLALPSPGSFNIGTSESPIVGFSECLFPDVVIFEYTYVAVGNVDDYVFSLGPSNPTSFDPPGPGLSVCDGGLEPIADFSATLTLNPTAAAPRPFGLARTMQGVRGRPDRAVVDVYVESFVADPVTDFVLADALDEFAVTTGQEQIVTPPVFVSGGGSLQLNPDFSLVAESTVGGDVITSDEVLVDGGTLQALEVVHIRYGIELDATFVSTAGSASASGTYLGGAVADESVSGSDPDPDGNGVPDEGGVTTFSNVDSDGDGIIDPLDGCPAERGAPFDRDLDGCIDDLLSTRNVEFWDEGSFPLPIVVHEVGSPDVGDGSDLTAIQDALVTWNDVATATSTYEFAGTTPQATTDALDGVNLVTFDDDVYLGPAVLAVAVTTSFTEPGFEFGGLQRRVGEIFDFDLIFNSALDFRTDTDGPAGGADLGGVAVHELGHGLGISHSSVPTSTMFFVLPPGAESRSLEPDDELTLFKAYPDPGALAAATQLSGLVLEDVPGVGQAPVPGVIVFAISATTGDSLGCDYTFLDGSFDFRGLPEDDYYVDIHPLDGSSNVGFITTASINQLVVDNAVLDVVPESWNAGDSFDDETVSPGSRDPINVLAGFPQTITIIAEQDRSGPSIVAVFPADGSTDVGIDTPVQVRFDEAISNASLSGNFRLEDGVGVFVPGQAFLYDDDTLLSFLPNSVLDFGATYTVVVDPEVTDRFGNELGTELRANFSTEDQPPVSLSTIAPNRGAPGALVALAGEGFAANVPDNEVRFGDTPVAILSGNATELLVRVPDEIATGSVSVTVTETGSGVTSNALTFTVIETFEVARGFEVGQQQFSTAPRGITIGPDGALALVPTTNGVTGLDLSTPDSPVIQDLGPGIGETTDVAFTADGSSAFAIGGEFGRISRFQLQPTPQLVNQTEVGFTLRGIIPDRAGRRAYVPTQSGGGVLIWDTSPTSSTFDSQIGVLETPRDDFTGKGVVDPSGRRLLLLAEGGDLLVYDLQTKLLEAQIQVGLEPNDVDVGPQGQVAYVTLEESSVSVVSLTSMEPVAVMNTVGALRGVDVSPAGSFLYAVNRQLNTVDVFDLRVDSRTAFQLLDRIAQPTDPLDLILSPDGVYAYTIVDGDQLLSVSAVGLGPALTGQSALALPVEGQLVLAGRGFQAPGELQVRFGGQLVTPDQVEDRALRVSVPANSSSGSVSVVSTDGGVVTGTSNALQLEVLGGSGSASLRLAEDLDAAPDPAAVQASVIFERLDRQRVILSADLDGGIHVLDIDPTRPEFHSWRTSLGLGSPVADLSSAAGSEPVYAALPAVQAVALLGVSDVSPDQINLLATFDLSLAFASPDLVEIGPEGRNLVVADRGAGQLVVVEANPTSAQRGAVLATVDLAGGGFDGSITALEVDPSGRVAYVAGNGSAGASLAVVALDRSASDFGEVVQLLPLGAATVADLDFNPQGDRTLVVFEPEAVQSSPRIGVLDASNLIAPSLGSDLLANIDTDPGRQLQLQVSPRGDRVLLAVEGIGFARMSFDRVVGVLANLATVSAPGVTAGRVRVQYDAGADRIYAFAESVERLLVYDRSPAETLTVVGGSNQAVVAGERPARPLAVKVASGGAGTPGVAVTFSVLSGDVTFAGTGTRTQVVLTGNDGIASAQVVGGTTLGDVDIRASSSGLAGSPAAFVLLVVQDPDTLPLELQVLRPVTGNQQVSITSAIQAIFSRAIDRSSLTAQSFGLFAGGAIEVAARVGSSQDGRVISLTPVENLEYDTEYEIRVTAGVTDQSGGSLTNPTTSLFRTVLPPAPRIFSISPQSGAAFASIVVRGEGFRSGLNQVIVGGTPAVIIDETTSYIVARVPEETSSDEVVVLVDGTTTNSVDFQVLEPGEPIEEAFADIPTGGAIRAFAIGPNGDQAYGLIPESDRVVPIDLVSLQSAPGISVGDRPFSIVVDPQGRRAYVVNLDGGSITILDVEPGSPTRDTVLDEIPVGLFPIDVAISPQGDRAFVVQFALGGSNLSVVDTDVTSETFGTVVASVGTSQRGKSVAVSPDGGRLYVGTSNGYVVFDAFAPGDGAIASVGRSSSTKQVSVSPDGGLLILLDVSGTIEIYDVIPGSPRQDTVVATVGGSSRSKATAVSPDGGLLYSIDADTDALNVYDLTGLGAGVAVRSYASGLPPTELPLIATIPTGEDPELVVPNPGRLRQVYVSNAGDESIRVLGVPSTIGGNFSLDQSNSSSLESLQFVTARIDLSGAIDVTAVEVDSLTIEGSLRRAQSRAPRFADDDADDVQELFLDFERESFESAVGEGDSITVCVSAPVGATRLDACTEITSWLPSFTFPAGGETIDQGDSVRVIWTEPPEAGADSVEILYFDGEEPLAGPEVVASRIPDVGFFDWSVESPVSGLARLVVTLYRDRQPIGLTLSEMFEVREAPVSVLLQTVAVETVGGDARLSFAIGGVSSALRGYRILRDVGESGNYVEVGRVPLADGRPSQRGIDFHWTDSDVEARTDYRYLLQEDYGSDSSDSRARFGPFSFRFEVSNSLSQNVPNSFNPRTIIRFGVAEKAKTRLVVYDIRGRRVRVLVDEELRPDVYEVVWDGTDDRGRRVSSGVYLYRMKTAKFEASRKMTLLR